jgi:hypothetical protein
MIKKEKHVIRFNFNFFSELALNLIRGASLLQDPANLQSA